MNLKSLFRRKYTLVYIALSDKDCVRVIGKLRDAGIFYKTKIKGMLVAPNPIVGGQSQSQYEIYVRVEDEHRANAAIHSNPR